MTRSTLSALGLTLLILAVVPAWYGCGLHPPNKPIPPPEAPGWPAEDPQDVLENLAWAYNQMDYERYFPLIRDGFTFVFDPDDVNNNIPGVPPSGVWGQSDELASAENMLDPNFIPEDPNNKIDNMQLDLQLSGDLVPTNLVSDPPPPTGTLEGFVTFDLRIQTVGQVDYLVNSRPLFFFAPASTTIVEADSTIIWSIWRIRDAPFGAGTPTAERAPAE